jgi:hypothetical protein
MQSPQQQITGNSILAARCPPFLTCIANITPPYTAANRHISILDKLVAGVIKGTRTTKRKIENRIIPITEPLPEAEK